MNYSKKLLDPLPEDVVFEYIAHALSQTCRFNGHCSIDKAHGVLAAAQKAPLNAKDANLAAYYGGIPEITIAAAKDAFLLRARELGIA
jgi:hypothetical protein